MFGVLLMSTAMLFTEVSSTIGKSLVQKKKETLYSMGFLDLLGSFLIFIVIIVFIRQEFLFSLASLPTFGTRAVLEIFQAHITMKAIIEADRTTFSFLRIITLPLLLMTDVIIGYDIKFFQLVGISIIILTLLFLLMNHGIRRKGMWFVIFTAVNAVITTSLYKYNISNFNSVEAEQFLIYFILLLYFLIGARIVTKENPIALLKKRIYLLQSASRGVAGVLVAFAFAFGPPSVIMAAKRAATVLWSIASGNLHFKEKRPLVKMIAFICTLIGIILLI